MVRLIRSETSLVYEEDPARLVVYVLSMIVFSASIMSLLIFVCSKDSCFGKKEKGTGLPPHPPPTLHGTHGDLLNNLETVNMQTG
ncbi:hypothetical protein OROMI_027466 [Orobanche minor]